MKKLLLGFLIFLCGITIAGQQPPQPRPAPPVVPQKYDTVAHLNALLLLEKQKNINLQMMLLEKQYKETVADAHQQYNEDEQQVSAWIEKVRKDNGWDASYVYDRETDTWTHAVQVHPATPSKPQPKAALPQK
jgi:hypothetical protein